LAATEGSPTAVAKKLPEASSGNNIGINKVTTNKPSAKTTLTATNGVGTNGKPGIQQEKTQNTKVVDSDVTFGSSPLSAVELMDNDDEQTIIEGMTVDLASVENDKELESQEKRNENTNGALGLDLEDSGSQEERRRSQEEKGKEDDDEQPVRSSVSWSKKM
jgi:hypothetical protein